MNVLDYFAILLYIFLVLSVLGNTLLIVAILREKQLQSITNYFVINLAVCDLIHAIFIPFIIEVNRKLMKWESYPFGAAGCKINILVNTYVKTTGLLSHVCIAIAIYHMISLGKQNDKLKATAAFILIHAIMN